jgi:hypothetical protein
MLLVSLAAALATSLAILAHVHLHPESAPVVGAWGRLPDQLGLIAVVPIALAMMRRSTHRPTANRPLQLALYIGTITWLTSCLYEYQNGGPTLFALVFGMGTWGALVAYGPALARRMSPSRLRALDLALVNVCLIVLGAEVGLRAMAHFVRTPLLQQQDAEAASRLRQWRFAPGRPYWGFPCNAQGFYDDPFSPVQPHHCRAVTIGDSFSIGVVPHDWHFTTVAERALGGCEVDNLGAVNIGPEEYALLVQEAKPLAPDVMVIDLFVGNDLLDLVGGGRLRSWFDRQNILIYLLPGRLLALMRERRHGGDGQVGGTAEAEGERLMSSAEARLAFPWLLDATKERARFSEEAYARIEGVRARMMTNPEFSGAVNYQRLFELLTAMRAAALPSRLAVMIIPDEYQVNDELWQSVAAGPSASLGRDHPQRIIGQWLAEQQIPYLDLLPILRAVPPLADGKRHLYHLRDTHFNARGNQVVGEALAAFLRPYVSP